MDTLTLQLGPDVYSRKAIITRKRRAANNKAARQLQAAINAYALAVAEARKQGKPAPFLADFLGGAA